VISSDCTCSYEFNHIRSRPRRPRKNNTVMIVPSYLTNSIVSLVPSYLTNSIVSLVPSYLANNIVSLIPSYLTNSIVSLVPSYLTNSIVSLIYQDLHFKKWTYILLLLINKAKSKQTALHQNRLKIIEINIGKTLSQYERSLSWIGLIQCDGIILQCSCFFVFFYPKPLPLLK
jgi:hypothetical protein